MGSGAGGLAEGPGRGELELGAAAGGGRGGGGNGGARGTGTRRRRTGGSGVTALLTGQRLTRARGVGGEEADVDRRSLGLLFPTYRVRGRVPAASRDVESAAQRRLVLGKRPVIPRGRCLGLPFKARSWCGRRGTGFRPLPESGTSGRAPAGNVCPLVVAAPSPRPSARHVPVCAGLCRRPRPFGNFCGGCSAVAARPGTGRTWAGGGSWGTLKPVDVPTLVHLGRFCTF
ncbi:uncharacterized protein [Narcine bancroftii]|uniref:uncharacterized protein n=1 Tax=Narcine bancroftii TaxID=1343680 RepID=UPI00383116E7